MTAPTARLSLIDGGPSHAAFQTEGPWDRPGTLYYWQGLFSSFAALPNDGRCSLPAAWYGHPAVCEHVVAATLEHWFQAIKATNPEDFAWVLSAPTAKRAKQRGGPRGEGGRTITLRPDWPQIKLGAMTVGQTAKFSIEPLRTLLLASGTATLVEKSPYDTEWGGYDARTDCYTGQNLHGISLMRARAHLIDEALRASVTPSRRPPYLTR